MYKNNMKIMNKTRAKSIKSFLDKYKIPYKPNELMKVLRERGLPIPDELTKETYQAANKSSLTPLLRSLRGEIQHWLENGCPDMTTGSTPKNPQTKDSQKSSQLRTPSGTSWSEIGFTYHSKNNSFSIKVKSKTLHCTPEEFFKLLPSKTSLELLLTITRAGGTFEKDLFDGNALKYFHKYLYRLRETLKDIFCIHEDPIESLGQGQFKTKFRARHRKNPDSLDAL